MKKEDNPEIGRLISSKDHDYPFYFDGDKFRSVPFDGMIQLDSIRSNGDFLTIPVYSKEAFYNLKAQLSSKEQELQTERKRNLEGEDILHDEIASLRAENERLKEELKKQEKSAIEFHLKGESLREENQFLKDENAKLTEIEYCQKCTINNISAEFAQLKSDLYHAQSNLELSGKRCEVLEAALKELLYKFTSPEVLEPAHELTDKCRKLLSQ